MSAPIICFGEILWDCLPRGRFLGGAPFNAACHLARLGRAAALVSAVGDDELGGDTLARVKAAGVSAEFVAVRANLPTGIAQAEVDAAGVARYVFNSPCAWDDIAGGEISAALRAAVRAAPAFIHGTLAARSASNFAMLEELLRESGPRKIFDVNLRPPHDDADIVIALARFADVVKLNDEELARLAGAPFAQDGDPRPLLETLRARTGAARWCVTLGARGAAWWDGGEVVRASAPPVKVRDTVGAGDAFVAALVDGLTRAKDWPGAGEMKEILARACRLGAFVASRDGACPEYDPKEVFSAPVLGA